MCGIAGLFDYRNVRSGPSRVDSAIGRQMVDSLMHRGPDDGGLVTFDTVMLGHRRLSILDLSDDGHQPMKDEASGAWIVFNGEIYNYRELRNELTELGHRFRSTTDTEVILLGYRQWGREALIERLSGMYAFAIWDAVEHALWLTRDPVGIKPLFYQEDQGCFRFGSEIKAILADQRVERRVDWKAISQFLTFGYTPAPATGFEGVRSLMPGCGLIVDRNGLHHHRHSVLTYPDQPIEMSMEEAVGELDDAINHSVRRQMIADVPVGAFLSGGLDSSAVVRSMVGESSSVSTFTIGFAERSFDESSFARMVADTYATKHHRELATEEMSSLLGCVVSHAEEPLADNSSLPFFMLCQSTRPHVKVALSGDGADELLAGYSTYHATELAHYFRLIPRMIRRGVLAPLAKLIPATGNKYSASMLAERFLSGADLAFPMDHCSWRRMIFPDLASRLFRGALQNNDFDPLENYASAVKSGPDWLSPNEQVLHGDLSFHLPNDMLVKVDRMSMANSLEVRVPLLDDEVIRACLRIPYDHKRKAGNGKLVLKKLLARDLPREITERKKSGFVVPVERWLSGPWRDLLEKHLCGRFMSETQVLDRSVVQQMIEEHQQGKSDHGYALFTLLSLAMWWEIWIDQSEPPQLVCPIAKPTRMQHVAGS
ncbi:Asparagine synthetase [glutamine-hydrolyzing] 1 [Rubripirellula amarantea]|uniref:asparagine synthase (glutamine-hydrolyzing) n=1 Tax=Rubripirellula amarantea TaxID=2527999 RepID=A0A5C5WFU1_9BACT|nr:asparagine synthase (glutamine-hydrolyzing) [Rubripirellula amarantea]TWT49520.1 Asparagine synthetase [glutamine-hydrolyzing] 1 [Rubripirellula amarantea]